MSKIQNMSLSQLKSVHRELIGSIQQHKRNLPFASNKQNATNQLKQMESRLMEIESKINYLERKSIKQAQ